MGNNPSNILTQRLKHKQGKAIMLNSDAGIGTINYVPRHLQPSVAQW